MYIIVAGEGGHFAQAKRLMRNASNIDTKNVIHITDNYKSALECFDVVRIESLRPKSNNANLKSLYQFFSSLKYIARVIKKNDVRRVVSLGPGISIPVAIISKCFGIKIIHIETWSRIKTKSLTGRVMYALADEFIVQHKDMLKIYPKAIYGGLL